MFDRASLCVYLEGRTLLVRVPEVKGARVLSTSPLDESRTHTPYWNPGLSRARLPVPPQGVVPTQHSPSLAYKELRWAIQLCIQHSTGTNTMLRDLDQPTH